MPDAGQLASTPSFPNVSHQASILMTHLSITLGPHNTATTIFAWHDAGWQRLASALIRLALSILMVMPYFRDVGALMPLSVLATGIAMLHDRRVGLARVIAQVP